MTRAIAHADTIPALLERAALDAPDAIAVVDGDRRVSYAELLAAVRRAAAGFVRLGVAAGDRVAVLGPNGFDWVTAALGALAAGGVLVPLNTRSPTPEVVRLLGRARCSTVVAAGRFRGERPAAEIAAAFDGTVVAMGADEIDGTVPWRQLCDSPIDLDGAVDTRLRALRPEQPSHILFTSGSTGTPKGVMLAHGAMVGTTRTWVQIVGLGPGDRYPVVNPLAHIGGFKTGLLACLIAKATAYPVATFDAAALLELIRTEHVTVLQGPPTVFHELIRAVGEQPDPVTSLRVAVTGSARIPPELVRAMRQTLGVESVLTAYGLTEATGVVTMTRRGDPLELICETSGRVVEGVAVRIARPDGSAAPTGEPGEILVAGPGLMIGYFDDDAETARATAGGWLRTGDVGTLDADGNLRIVDRLKDVVIVGGFNAYPAEIERVLLDHADVELAGVVGVPDERLGEVPVAFVVPRNGSRPDPVELARWCADRLANYKVPRRVWLVDTLPLTPVGKVDKAGLRSTAVGPPAVTPSG